MATEVLDILLRLAAAGVIGGCIGFERRMHHKAIGIAGMVLIAIGSTTYMLLGRHLAGLDPSSSWNYSPAEILVDGIVHALGVGLGLLGAIILIVRAPSSLGTFALTALLVYATALLAMLGISAAYNMWPVSPTKWVLRRFDHSAIYLMIAGTYTPLVIQLKASYETIGLLIGVWTVAVIGAALKLVLPGRFDGLSIVLYLLLGWSVVVVYDTVLPALPFSALLLLALGGLLYSGGVAFHVWRSLRFQNAIWHAFVLMAAASHWGAVLHTVVLAQS